MAANVGPITNIVRNNDRPMMTWFGGTFCVDSALRVKPSTMTMRVNAVIVISAAGSRVRAPSSTAMPIGLLVSPPLFVDFWPGVVGVVGALGGVTGDGAIV